MSNSLASRRKNTHANLRFSSLDFVDFVRSVRKHLKNIGSSPKTRYDFKANKYMVNWALLTEGYFLAGVKHVDLCTLSYHHGAHIPSTGFGPASHLQV